MPELPEVETIRRGLALRLTGRRIVGLDQRRPDLRAPLPSGLSERLVGRRIEGFARRGKFILATLDDGWTLLFHLGMSGRLVLDGASRGPHEHLTFLFDDGSRLRFVDPRRFGMLDLWPSARLAEHPSLRDLGVEPLDSGFDARLLEELLRGRRAPLKSVLMDQRVVAGLGNIYANEALFRARLCPLRAASTLGPVQIARLVAAIRGTLDDAIAKGGTSLRDYVQANGELGSFQNDFMVYDREGQPCPVCSRPIRRIVQAGRSTYFCSRCQR